MAGRQAAAADAGGYARGGDAFGRDRDHCAGAHSPRRLEHSPRPPGAGSHRARPRRSIVRPGLTWTLYAAVSSYAPAGGAACGAQCSSGPGCPGHTRKAAGKRAAGKRAADKRAAAKGGCRSAQTRTGRRAAGIQSICTQRERTWGGRAAGGIGLWCGAGYRRFGRAADLQRLQQSGLSFLLPERRRRHVHHVP